MNLFSTIKKYLKWLLCVICAIGVVCALVGLGFWQLHRYHYKKHLMMRYAQAKVRPALSMSALIHRQHIEFMPLKVSGESMPHRAIWVENDLNGGSGYNLVVPIKVDGYEPWLLVNFGWLPARAGHQLPKMPESRVRVFLGHVRTPQRLPWLIGDNIRNPGQFPLDIQSLDMVAIQKVLGHELFPFVLYLDAKKGSIFKRDFVVTTVMPRRHLIYAIQWFLFAVVFLVGLALIVRKRMVKHNG